MTPDFQNVLDELHTGMDGSRLDGPSTTRFRTKATHDQPLTVGELAPFFSLSGQSGDWRASIFNQPLSGPTLSVLDLIRNKPLVVGFYCACWGRYASTYLDSLERLNEDLQRAGAELVVLSNEPPKALVRQGRRLNFLFAHDVELRVSRQFGVYNEDNPVWERVSGISDDAFTPALYVVGQDRRIAYQFLDENFDTPVDSEAILRTVYSLTATDPDISTSPTALNRYSRGFFACWLLGVLATAGAHYLHF